MHLSTRPFSSWTLPPLPHCCAPAVLPPGGLAGGSPKPGTEALFPEDKLPLPGGPEGTVPPGPRPVLLVDFTGTSGFCGPGPHSSAAQEPWPLLSCLLMTPGRQVPSQSLLVAMEPSKESILPPLATSGLVSLSEPFYPGKPVSRLLQDALNEWP